jgi:hypothetical protein
MESVHGRFLLANLAGCLSLVARLVLLAALHALTHPIAHDSCLTHWPEQLQPSAIDSRGTGGLRVSPTNHLSGYLRLLAH